MYIEKCTLNWYEKKSIIRGNKIECDECVRVSQFPNIKLLITTSVLF